MSIMKRFVDFVRPARNDTVLERTMGRWEGIEIDAVASLKETNRL